MILRDQKSWSGRSATERLFWTTDNSIELASRSTDWVAREWSLKVWLSPPPTLYSVTIILCAFPFYYWSFYHLSLHSLIVLVSCYHWSTQPLVKISPLVLYQQFYFVIILDQQIHLLTHRFMFIFLFFFLSHLVHVRSVYIGPVEALIPDIILFGHLAIASPARRSHDP